MNNHHNCLVEPLCTSAFETKQLLASVTSLMKSVSPSKYLPTHVEIHRTVFEGYDNIPDDVSDTSSGGVSITDLNAQVSSCNKFGLSSDLELGHHRSVTPQGCQL